MYLRWVLGSDLSRLQVWSGLQLIASQRVSRNNERKEKVMN